MSLLFRKAKMSDVEKIAALINFYADKGAMLPRTIPFIYQKIREYTVIEDNGSLIAGQPAYPLERPAEICSLLCKENTNKEWVVPWLKG